MGTITEAQRKWLEGLGVNTGVAVAAPVDEDSPTKGGETRLVVAARYLQPGARVALIDDFLANGRTALALAENAARRR